MSVLKRKFDPRSVTVITTCMNRFSFLEASIVTWNEMEFKDIVVVDWNSREPVAEKLMVRNPALRGQRITVIRSDRHYRNQYFNDGWARNTGARLCKTEFILFLDSDMKIVRPELFFDSVPLNNNICYRGNIPGGYGSCLVDRKKFNAVNGYSERMWSWGGEDLDFYIRLTQQQGCEIETFFPDPLFEHIHHDDISRTENRLQEWDDLKEGANVQRLKREPWTRKDNQVRVDARIFEFEQMSFRSQSV